MEIDGTKTSHFYLEIFAVYITMEKKKRQVLELYKVTVHSFYK